MALSKCRKCGVGPESQTRYDKIARTHFYRLKCPMCGHVTMAYPDPGGAAIEWNDLQEVPK